LGFPARDPWRGWFLWRNPLARLCLLFHWTSSQHPYRHRFIEQLREVVALLKPTGEDDDGYDAYLRTQGRSLRTVTREIPPIFGEFSGTCGLGNTALVYGIRSQIQCVKAELVQLAISEKAHQ